MELRERKKIINTKKLPGFFLGGDSEITDLTSADGQEKAIKKFLDITGMSDNGMAASPEQALMLISQAIVKMPMLALSIDSALTYDKHASDIMKEAGTTQGNIQGIGYEKINPINFSKVAADAKKEAHRNSLDLAMKAGSILPLPQVVLGGLGAGKLMEGHLKRKAQKRALEAQAFANNLNQYSLSEALTGALLQDFAKTYGNSDDQVLTAKRGKDAANAIVAGGESIVDNVEDAQNIKGKVVDKGKLGVDSVLANINDSTTVYGFETNQKTGNTFAEDAFIPTKALENVNKLEKRDSGSVYAKNTINLLKKLAGRKLQDLAKQQKLQHLQEGYVPEFKSTKGKIKAAGGYDSFLNYFTNLTTNLIGGATGLMQYLQAKHSTPYAPNIYSGNPYERRALSELAGLRVSPYPVIQQLRDAEARANAAINMSGGLSGAQKYLGRLSALNTTQQNIAKMLPGIQVQNNQYLQNYANAAMQAGNSLAARRQAAKQYGEEYYAKSHAARQRGMQQGIQNMMNYLQNYAANQFKLTQFDKMMDAYEGKNRGVNGMFANNNLGASKAINNSGFSPLDNIQFFQIDPLYLLGAANFLS